MKLKKMMVGILTGTMMLSTLTGCASKKAESVVIYSNADDEVIVCMEEVLKENGYEGKYIIQGFGTSELGGKLLAEGSNVEADLITMSSYYIDSAQEKNNMFKKLDFEVNTTPQFPDYQAPITAQEGAIFYNTEVLQANNLPVPTSIKDFADPVYKGMISVSDINSSSTAWLFMQAFISAYGTGEEAQELLTAIYENAGDHIESSGSGPIKKVRAGEVAIGFGLRHQAVADKKEGLPIEYVDQSEGNFSLNESLAVIDKGDKSNPLAMEIAKCLVETVRPGIMEYYPNAIYEGEVADSANASKNPKIFEESLTVDLLEEHIAFSETCRSAAK